jgi:hypothetical protein
MIILVTIQRTLLFEDVILKILSLALLVFLYFSLPAYGQDEDCVTTPARKTSFDEDAPLADAGQGTGEFSSVEPEKTWTDAVVEAASLPPPPPPPPPRTKR